MKVLVIRHAIAEDRDEFARSGRDDELRPLTDVGRTKMRAAAEGLARLVESIDLLATSPLVRAVQTAEIVAAAFGGIKPKTTRALEPGADDALFAWLAKQSPSRTIALVGHEPDLSRFISRAVSGRSRSFVNMKKGAACLIEFADAPQPGGATLRWLLEPGQLRRLRD